MTETPSLSPKPYTIERSALTVQDADFILDSYLMHIKSTKCRHCGGEASWSEIFEVHTHRRHTAISTLRRLIPAKTVQRGFELGVSNLPTKEIPICDKCLPTLAVNDLPASYPVPNDASWATTLRKKAQQAKDERTTTPPSENVVPFVPLSSL